MSDELFLACVAAAYQLRSRTIGGTLPPPAVPPVEMPPPDGARPSAPDGARPSAPDGALVPSEPGEFAPPS
jgi:hypothetical protein